MNDLSNRLMSLSESETLVMSQKSAELKAQGVDVINLSVGEPDFSTPEHIKEAAKKAIDDNFSFYSPVTGFLDLRKAICDKLKKENNLTYAPDQIVCSNGAKQSVCNVILAIVSKGDEVIIPAPYWVSYPEMVTLADGKSVSVYAGIEQDFKITAAQLEEAITPKTKALILCSPSNPTGSVYSKDELSALADVLAKYPNIIIISDEIYEHINYLGSHESIAQFENIRERVVIVNGVSKGYAMTGWRLGFVAAAKWIVDAIDKLQGQVTSGTNSIAQRAAVVAFEDMSAPAMMKEAYLRRRDLVVGLLKDIEGFKVNTPEGAFYAFPDVSYYYGKSDGTTTIKNGDDLSMWILEKAFVATVAGSGFGAPNCIRISTAAADEVLVEAVQRIKDLLSTLK